MTFEMKRITLFRFDQDGKIVAEIDEESDPGPVERLALPDSSFC